MIQEFVASYPAWFIIVASFFIVLLITLIYKYTSNQGEMKRLREELNNLQKKSKEHRGNQEKMLELQKELAEKNLEYMRHSFKPMLFTFLPVIIIFYWLSGLYKEITTVLVLPLVGWHLSWIWTYIIFSL